MRVGSGTIRFPEPFATDLKELRRAGLPERRPAIYGARGNKLTASSAAAEMMAAHCKGQIRPQAKVNAITTVEYKGAGAHVLAVQI